MQTATAASTRSPTPLDVADVSDVTIHESTAAADTNLDAASSSSSLSPCPVCVVAVDDGRQRSNDEQLPMTSLVNSGDKTRFNGECFAPSEIDERLRPTVSPPHRPVPNANHKYWISSDHQQATSTEHIGSLTVSGPQAQRQLTDADRSIDLPTVNDGRNIEEDPNSVPLSSQNVADVQQAHAMSSYEQTKL